MNKKGHPATLQARQPGNRNAVKSGVHSKRYLDEMAQPLLDEMASLPHIQPADRFALEEAARMRAFNALADDDLLRNGLTNRRGEPRSLLVLRLRSSKQLQQLLVQLGMTPLSRRAIAPQESVAGKLAQLQAARDEDTDVEPGDRA